MSDWRGVGLVVREEEQMMITEIPSDQWMVNIFNESFKSVSQNMISFLDAVTEGDYNSNEMRNMAAMSIGQLVSSLFQSRISWQWNFRETLAQKDWFDHNGFGNKPVWYEKANQNK